MNACVGVKKALKVSRQNRDEEGSKAIPLMAWLLRAKKTRLSQNAVRFLDSSIILIYERRIYFILIIMPILFRKE